MTPEMTVTLMTQTLYTVLIVAGPLLAAGLIIGVLVSIFQTVTQIREMSLTFVPKIVGVMVVLAIFAPWMTATLIDYTESIFRYLPQFVR
ncbi:MAG: flagellar biosynthesis protein FliQ [Verrucomicrobia bacterium]|nr:flagellar biosynthesis protein FliQ [Verrucomicrobiota bacterium]